MQEVNERLNSCAQSEDLHMRDVVFKVWNNQESFLTRPVRYSPDKNVTVVEATGWRLKHTWITFEGKFMRLLQKGILQLQSEMTTKKLSTFIQNGEQLIVSDVLTTNGERDERSEYSHSFNNPRYCFIYSFYSLGYYCATSQIFEKDGTLA